MKYLWDNFTGRIKSRAKHFIKGYETFMWQFRKIKSPAKYYLSDTKYLLMILEER